MNSECMHNPSSGAKQVFHWYKKAQIDYIEYYLNIYIAYNAWYCEVTSTRNDRQAIDRLKKRFVIWDDYCTGKAMRPMRVYMERLVDFTQKEPFSGFSSPYWNGEIAHADDWRSLIEFWYQIRCSIVHGAEVKPKYAWLAYETLDIFMGEIVQRIQSCLESPEYKKLQKLSTTVGEASNKSDRFERLQHKLYQKYISLPDIWQVDMQRV